jgi:aqualysin 1
MRRVVVLLVSVVVATLLVSGMAITKPSGDGQDRFIVVLKSGVDNPGEVAANISRRNNAEVGFVYRNALKGFSAAIPNSRVAEVRADDQVDYVERDGTMKTVAQTLPWGINRIDADTSSTLAGNGSGGITNVNAYVIDTGIDATHPDLNVVGHVNFAGGKNTDCNGHGTHVSGTVAARDNLTDVVGVAPGAPLTGVKVLGCSGSGSTSGVIKGVDWVTANAKKPAIANMSLGGGTSRTLDDAVKRSATSGVFYSLSAGNSGTNACGSSPARAGTSSGVMTTAATDSQNREASFSNYGSCVDTWAPGVSILSTRKGGGTKTYSGTSMASPHVGGTGALYLSSNTGASPAAVENVLQSKEKNPGTTSKDGRQIELLYAGDF